MDRRTRLYIGAVLVASALAFGVVAIVAPSAQASAIPAIATMSALALLAELLSYELMNGARGSINFIPYLAALLLSPSALALSCCVGAIGLAYAVRRIKPIKILFNVSQFALGGSLGILVFLLLGGTPMLDDTTAISSATQLSRLPAAAALVVAFLTTNSLAVQGVLALNDKRPMLAGWLHALRRSFAYDVFFSPVVYLVAWVYVHSGFWGVLVLTAPLLVVRQLYKTNYQLERVNQELLELMVKAIEARDPYTSGHSRRVSQYSRIIGRAIGLSGTELDRVCIAALLHDVGKIHEVYAPILRKPEKLTPAEWSVMQTHPIKSAELVSTVSHLKDVVDPIRHHHENWDGTGYPEGLEGEGIPLAARIILFADTIDAMTTDRPYRKALTEAQVRSELIKFRGKQFDPDMCDKLLASPMFGLLFAPQQRSKTPDRWKPAVGGKPDGVAAQS